jgi:hypothetical protein
VKISQREARRLRKRVQELEAAQRHARNRWSSDYPGGACLGCIDRDKDWLSGRIEAARLLGHAVVITENNEGRLTFHALPIS